MHKLATYAAASDAEIEEDGNCGCRFIGEAILQKLAGNVPSRERRALRRGQRRAGHASSLPGRRCDEDSDGQATPPLSRAGASTETATSRTLRMPAVRGKRRHEDQHLRQTNGACVRQAPRVQRATPPLSWASASTRPQVSEPFPWSPKPKTSMRLTDGTKETHKRAEEFCKKALHNTLHSEDATTAKEKLPVKANVGAPRARTKADFVRETERARQERQQ